MKDTNYEICLTTCCLLCQFQAKSCHLYFILQVFQQIVLVSNSYRIIGFRNNIPPATVSTSASGTSSSSSSWIWASNLALRSFVLRALSTWIMAALHRSAADPGRRRLVFTWLCHGMEIISALLVLCEEKPLVLDGVVNGNGCTTKRGKCTPSQNAFHAPKLLCNLKLILMNDLCLLCLLTPNREADHENTIECHC